MLWQRNDGIDMVLLPLSKCLFLLEVGTIRYVHLFVICGTIAVLILLSSCECNLSMCRQLWTVTEN